MTTTDVFPSFTEFFSACHGHPPHHWQAALADQVAREGWPGLVDVPTGLGKTACVDVAVYELARQLRSGAPRTAPLRVFHVIGRRAVVDDAANHMRRLADAVNGVPALEPVRRSLRAVLGSGDEDAVVATSAIHGGRRDDRVWLRATGCTLVTLTAHQFVSRLLFRGFGVSPGTRPIHAALCGVDRLVLFDEPHLALPALTAILDAERLQQAAREELGVPLGRTVVLGATTPPQATGHINGAHSFDPDAETGADARRRIAARRPLRVDKVASTADSVFAERLARLAADTWARNQGSRVAVMVNTVAMAQDVARRLRSRSHPDKVTLVTSRLRPLDRPDVRDNTAGLTVATQCLEVGVDITFDTIITEACPYPALVQRLGRLNRDGNSPHDPHGILVTAKTGKVRAATGAVYEESTVTALLHLLDEVAGTDGVVDMSITGQRALRGHPLFDNAHLWGAAPRSATLHSGLVPLLTHSRPTPVPDLPVDAFINGPDTERRLDVLVTWRDDLDCLEDCPPLPPESVAVPVWALRTFLRGGTSAATVNDAVDVSGEDTQPVPAGTKPKNLAEVRVKQDDGWAAPRSVYAIQPGAEVVLRTSVGGYRPDLGWEPASEAPVKDLSATAAVASVREGGRKARFPVSAATLAEVSGPDMRDWYQEKTSAGEDLEPGILEDALREGVRSLLGRDSPQVAVTVGVSKGGTVIARIHAATRTAKGPARTVYLDDHQNQVAQWTRADAAAVGLPGHLVEQLAVAGQLHDSGKAQPVFQHAIGGPHQGRALAKSLPNRSVEVHPAGWRHEGRSVKDAQQQGCSPLTTHVVGAHHGWNRPILPAVGDSSQARGVDCADQFHHLNNDYGPWGLAYLETVMRLADWKASEEPDTGYAPVAVSPQSRAVPSPAVPSVTTALAGLRSHPLTGWFAVAGLLGAATDLGDSGATIHWVPVDSEFSTEPAIPAISSVHSLEELVHHIRHHPEWGQADRLTGKHDVTPLKVKHQKSKSAGKLRNLLLEADDQGNSLVLTLIGDLAPAVGDATVMPITPAANNSSYPSAAITSLTAETDEEAVASLVDELPAYQEETCDGGMDRPLAESTHVNGIGNPAQKLSRRALAPLAIYGMASLGAAPLEGHGVNRVNRRRELRLPLPTTPTTLNQLRALLPTAWTTRHWDWEAIGNTWTLAMKVTSKGKSEHIWNGGPQRKSE